MTARRRSARLAMAVSSILAAPALVTGLGLVAGLAVAPEARAQETASQMAGYVLDSAGNPVAGAQVTILHAPTGTSTTVTSGATGLFVATGLRVGGPYTVSASADGYQGSGVDNVYTELGRRATLTLSMYPTAQLAEVEITAAAERATAIGVGAEFSAQKIAELPSISRDLKDTVRIDPKAWVDPTNSDALEVAGVNNRYNSITVDGVRQSDDFGLNNNGYPTQRAPISLDAIQAVSLLTAPFDVQYSAFRGSTINIVTKSGTNEFDGSLFYYTYDNDLVGDKSESSRYTFAFDQETYGATIGGPIIRDKLFFFASYEKLDRSSPQDYGPTGSGAAVEVGGVTQAEYDLIVGYADSVYGFDAGELFGSLPEDDEKVLAKIDWNISDNHRASLAYQRTEGNEIIPTNNSASGRDLSTPSDWYNRAITLDSYAFQFFSNWSERFSTELKVARKEVEVLQESLGGTDFAMFRVCARATTTSSGCPSSEAEVFIGPDIFRHANYLTNDLDALKLKGNLFLGKHTLTFGYEKEQLSIFNLFVRQAEGEYYFDSIADFQNRQASRLDYQNAYSNDENDAAADFGYDTDSFYLQDKWQVTDTFELQYGLRYDTWSGSDRPLLAQNFQTRYGYPNTETLDGRDILMPRVGFNWQVGDDTVVRGGVGLFGGGTPNVWVSNSFSNDGVTVVSQSIRRSSPTSDSLPPECDENGRSGPPPVPPVPGASIGNCLNNIDGYNINQAVQDWHETLRGDGGVNAIHPDFEIPSQWRFNLGVEHTFADDWRVSADVLYSTVKDEIFYQDVRLVQSGTAPDGRPIYSQAGPSSRGSSTQDLVLSNTSQGRALVWTIDLAKTWVTRAGIFDLYTAYGHQDVLDVNPGTSSQASSNWDYLAVADPNNPALSRSNYEIEHRFTLSLNWRKDFFKDLFTSAGLFLEHRSGRPYSYTFARNTTFMGDPRQSSRQRQLFYVPANETDVLYENGLTWAAMQAFIEEQGLTQYMGQIMPRNSHTSPWVTTASLRIAQEIPTFIKGTRGVLTLDVENLTNLINSDWGRLEQVSFPYVAPAVDARIDSTTGKYVYRPISGTTPNSPFFSGSALPSVWRIQLGVRFEF